MYHTSSQKGHWIFSGEEEINGLRKIANESFVEKFKGKRTVEEIKSYFLTPEEEIILLKGSELTLRDFCRKFSPPMFKCVTGTAFHFFKRFYVNNSVMDYHPKEILVTCAYLACKVEEFNVSIQQFVNNIKGDREKATEIILNNELLLMHHLGYHLTIHNPFRPIEGFLMDLKTRYKNLRDPERLRPPIDEFLDKVYLTDVVLLYAPSQIALAAVLHAASQLQENLDVYVTDTLFEKNEAKIGKIIEAVRDIRLKIRLIESPGREILRQLDDKLSRCRNQENNPDSEIYKKRLLEMVDEEDPDRSSRTTEEILLETSPLL